VGFNYHGAIESDASLTRGDYFWGDDHTINMTKWGELVALADGYTYYNMTLISNWRYAKYQEGLATNPGFYWSPVRYIMTTGAAYFAHSIFRVPGSEPTYDTMYSFFVDETFPADYQPPTTPVSLAGVLDAVFQFYTDHPVPLFVINFPSCRECLDCYFAASLFNDIFLLDVTLVELILGNIDCVYPYECTC